MHATLVLDRLGEDVGMGPKPHSYTIDSHS